MHGGSAAVGVASDGGARRLWRLGFTDRLLESVAVALAAADSLGFLVDLETRRTERASTLVPDPTRIHWNRKAGEEKAWGTRRCVLGIVDPSWRRDCGMRSRVRAPKIVSVSGGDPVGVSSVGGLGG